MLFVASPLERGFVVGGSFRVPIAGSWGRIETWVRSPSAAVGTAKSARAVFFGNRTQLRDVDTAFLDRLEERSQLDPGSREPDGGTPHGSPPIPAALPSLSDP
jgi:hypothetical protein